MKSNPFYGMAGIPTSEDQVPESLREQRYHFIALTDHYEGIGFHTKAEANISNMWYSGEKFQMNWENFERELNLAWPTLDKVENIIVY